MVRVADLFTLQELDSDIDARERTLADIRARLGAEDALAETRASVEAFAETIRVSGAAQRAAAADVADARAKAAPVEENLYSGRVTNARELRDLQKELELLQKHQQAEEEKLLQVLADLDEARAGLGDARRALADGESAWQSGQQELEREADGLDTEIAALKERRALAMRPIDAASLTLYERLRKMRSGRAVARVQRGTCLGCRIALPSTLFQRARSGFAIVQCSSCERILYVG